MPALWLRDDNGKLTRAFQHICWDGCMFPNAMMMDPRPGSNILATMIAVRRRARLGLDPANEAKKISNRDGRLRLHGPTHSNAFLQAAVFSICRYQPVLKAVCARNTERVRGVRRRTGAMNRYETDWRKLVERRIST